MTFVASAALRALHVVLPRDLNAFRSLLRSENGPVLGLDIGTRHVGMALSDAGYVSSSRAPSVTSHKAERANYTLPRASLSDDGNFFQLQEQPSSLLSEIWCDAKTLVIGFVSC
jgi:RNase H-fold protein (predicted Holliday junction resolvase)